MKLLKKQKCFQKPGCPLRDEDYRELTKYLTYKQFEAKRKIYEYNDIADHFYIIVKGRVSSQIRNSKINNWDWAMTKYKGLLDWKTNEFDPIVQKEM